MNIIFTKSINLKSYLFFTGYLLVLVGSNITPAFAMVLNGTNQNTTIYLPNGNSYIYASNTFQNKGTYALLRNHYNGDLYIDGTFKNKDLAQLLNSNIGSTITNRNNGQINNINGASIINYYRGKITNTGSNANINNNAKFINKNNGSFIYNRSGASFINDGDTSAYGAGIFNTDGGSFYNQNNNTKLNNINKGQIENKQAYFYNQSGAIINNEQLSKISNFYYATMRNESGSTINNSGLLLNASNSNLINISSGSSISTINNYAGSQIQNQSTSKFENRFSSVINNSGRIWNLGGTLNNFEGSTINNKDQLLNSTYSNTASTINNYGIGSTINNSSEATLQNASSKLYNQQGAQINNSGSIRNYGDFLNTNASTLTNKSGGIIDNYSIGDIVNQYGSIIDNQSGSLFKNRAKLTNRLSGTVINDGNITNEGSFVQETNAEMKGSGSYTQTEGSTTLSGNWTQGKTTINGGSFNAEGTVNGSVVNNSIINATGTGLTMTGNVSGSGNYTGKTTFTGSFGPGNSPALITAEELIFTSTNTLIMELGGLIRGSEYDAIDATSILLAGDLEIDLIDLGSGIFNPVAGNYFDLLVANDITGSFDTLIFDTLANGLDWSLSIIQEQQNDILRLNVLNSTPPTTGVPEPGSITLLVLGLLTMIVLHKRSDRDILNVR